MSDQISANAENKRLVQASIPSTIAPLTTDEMDTMKEENGREPERETERETESDSIVETSPPGIPLSPIRAPPKTIKSEMYDPLSPTRSPEEFKWVTLSESISNFRAKFDKENHLNDVKDSRDFRSHGDRTFKKEPRNNDVKEYRKEYESHEGRGFHKYYGDYGSKVFKTEYNEYREYRNECGGYKEVNKACSSFRSYDPLDDISYFYEPKRTALKSNFASQLEQYFILDTPFTLTKSIEEDYPAPNNHFLVPPKWDLYAELFVEQAAEAHNWAFSEKKMIGITDARLLKAQNAIVRVSGPLIRTLGTKVTTDGKGSYHAIWICIGYAFWFLSRVRRQLLLEAVLGTRDKKRIDRYLNDANKMSMFWPDNSDLLGKKFFDHIVQSERRQEEFRDVLMKDARRNSDQRERKHDPARYPSTNSWHLEDSSAFEARRRSSRGSEASASHVRRVSRHCEVYTPSERRGSRHADFSSSPEERAKRKTKTRSSSEERGSRHPEVSSSSGRRRSTHYNVSSSSDEHSSRHTKRKVRASSAEPNSKHNDVRDSREKYRSRQCKSFHPQENRSQRHPEISVSLEELSSRCAEILTSDQRSGKGSEISCTAAKQKSENREVRTHGGDRDSRYALTRSTPEDRGSRFAEREAKASSHHGDKVSSHHGDKASSHHGDKASSHHGDKRKSDGRVKSSEVSPHSPTSYKGIPLFSDVIPSDFGHLQVGQCSISGDEKEGNSFCRRSSKRARTSSGFSVKKNDCSTSETSVVTKEKDSAASKEEVDCEPNGPEMEEEEEEEEGEIRDIFTPFSLSGNEGSKSFLMKQMENSCSHTSGGSSKSTSQTKEHNSKVLFEEKETIPLLHTDRKEDIEPLPEKKECSNISSDSERTGNRAQLSSQGVCEEDEEEKEWTQPPFKKRKLGPPRGYSGSGSEELLRQKTEEIAAQFDKNMKLEVEISFLKDTNKKLNDVNRELEDNLQSNQEQLEQKGSLISELQRETDQLKRELDQVKEDRGTFQTLACEKDTRISSLKTDNEAFKLKERGWNMEKKKLTAQIEELQAQVAAQTKLLTEKEDSLKKLQRDIDLLNSDQTVNEQHRQQLTNLRVEIEQRKDKEKMFELEKLRLEKDKLVQDIETKAKLRHGEMEKSLDHVTDENSKLQANLAALQNKLQEQLRELEEERETNAMFRAESERDIKLQKQNAAVELEELKEQTMKRDAAFQERIAGLQLELQNRPSSSRGDAGDSSTNADQAAAPDTDQLTQQLRDQAREIENLRAVRARSLQIAVTQFQKGDTVFFYYDDTKSNYLVANISPNDYQYFLHPDNLGALGLSLEPPGRKPWAIGVIKDKEFCQARKVNNRFKVAEGKKFYRVYAQPRATVDQNNAAGNSSRNPD